jgi:hypothetical protein
MKGYVIGWINPNGRPTTDPGLTAHWIRLGGPYSSTAKAIKAGDEETRLFPMRLLGQAYDLIGYLIIPSYKMAKYGLLAYGEPKQPLPGFDEVGP